MKLDKDLVREILLKLESDDEHPFSYKDLSFDDHPDTGLCCINLRRADFCFA